MNDGWITRTTGKVRFILRQKWPVLLIIQVALLFFYMPKDSSGPFESPSRATLPAFSELRVLEGQVYFSHQSPPCSLGGEIKQDREVTNTNRVMWICAKINLEQNHLEKQPLILFVRGLFSADLFWNGVHFSEKGTAGETKKKENPGRYSLSSAIPNHLLRSGENILALKVSSFYSGFSDEAIFSKIELLEVGQTGDQNLGKILLSVLVLGALFFMILFQIMHTSKATSPNLLKVNLAMLVLLSLTSGLQYYRFVYNFVYNLYVWYAVLYYLFILGFGTLLIWFLLKVHKLPLKKAALALTFVGYVLIYGFFNSDYYIGGHEIQYYLILAVFLGAAALFRKDKSGFCTLAGVGPIIIFDQIAPIHNFFEAIFVFLGSYFLFVLLTGAYKGLGPLVFSKKIFFSPNPDTKLKVSAKGSLRTINQNKIMFLQSAGNYTEIKDAEGATFLHNKRLGQLLLEMGPGFLRIHRSYAVNEQYIDRITIKQDGQYSLLLKDKTTLPVGRTFLKKIKANLI